MKVLFHAKTDLLRKKTQLIPNHLEKLEVAKAAYLCLPLVTFGYL